MISQITTSKGRADDILRNLSRWIRSDIDQLIIVDWNCPDFTTERVLSSSHGRNPKLVVLQVGYEVAGPFFNPGRAKNIGAQAAKGDTLWFLDADTYFNSRFIDHVLEDYEERPELFTFAPKDLVSRADDGRLTKEIPAGISIHGQVLISNSLFFRVNGFSEEQSGWGCETYDLLLRAMAETERATFIDPSEFSWVSVPTPSEQAGKYLPRGITTEPDNKLELYQYGSSFFASLRNISTRAQPGRRFGLSGYTPHVKMYVGGVEQNFNPCEG